MKPSQSLDLGDPHTIWKLWARFLIVHHVGGGSLHQLAGELSPDERTYMIDFIRGYRVPMRVLLVAWGLPTDNIDNGTDFWYGKILPLLERRQSKPQRTKRDRARSIDRFARAKETVDIVDIASRYTSLRGSRLLKGLCPLHDEKTPSFVVWTDSQRWRCFGACGSGGDVVELTRRLMEVGKW